MNNTKKIITIGGSAGSLPVVLTILQNLSPGFIIPVVIVLHRLKNIPSEMDKIVSITRSDLRLHEPDDKQPVEQGAIYIAPANYHLLVEADRSFGLDYSEPVQYSRPSIDVTFESIAAVYGKDATAILLSGANNDGMEGISRIIEKGGTGIVQDPLTSEYPVMPVAAIRKNPSALVMRPLDIVNYLQKIEPF
jgi:two-component system chemotaxis response regulator CheB